jgi:hypothetical protein
MSEETQSSPQSSPGPNQGGRYCAVYPAAESSLLGKRTITFRSEPIYIWSGNVVMMQDLGYTPDRVINEPPSPFTAPLGASPFGDGPSPEFGDYWKIFLEDGTTVVTSLATLLTLLLASQLGPVLTYQDQVILGKAKIKTGVLAAMFVDGNTQQTAAPISIEKYPNPVTSQPVAGDFYVAKLKGGKKVIIDQDGFDSITGTGFVPA